MLGGRYRSRRNPPDKKGLIGGPMAFDNNLKQKRPIYGIDLQDDLPSQGDDLRALAKFFHSSELNLGSIFSVVRSDGTYDREAMDDFSDLMERIIDNISANRLKFGSITDVDNLIGITSDQDVTSSATKEWTVGSGKCWIVLFLSASNDNRNTSFHATITPDGGTAVPTGQSRVTAASATAANGGSSVLGGIESPGAVTTPIVLNEGDKIKITDNAFTAGDTVAKNIAYVEITK